MRKFWRGKAFANVLSEQIGVYPVKPSCKKYANLASIFLVRLARSCTKSCKSWAKNEAFLARYKNLTKTLQENRFKIIFFQNFDHILQENYLTIFLARFLQDFVCSARKALFLVQNLQDMSKI